MENLKTYLLSNKLSKRKKKNISNNMNHHNEEQKLFYSSEDTNDSIVPSDEDLISWCMKRTTQLETATKSARSRTNEHQGENKEGVTGKNSLPGKRVQNEKNRRQNYPYLPKSFPSPTFQGDQHYFEKNKHPSILQMLKISEETGARYDNIFYRLCQLRIMNNAVCRSNDTCERVFKYFDPRTVYNVQSIDEKDLPLLYKEFRNFVNSGPVLDTGNVHLIADKFHIPPNVVREYYLEWHSTSHNKSPDISLLISQEQKLYDREMELQKDFHKALADHDYGREIFNIFKIRSILRIIRKKPDLTVSDAFILSKLYKMDIKFIQKLIQGDEDVMFSVQHSLDNTVYFREQCTSIGDHCEVKQGSVSNKSKRTSRNGEYSGFSASRSMQPMDISINQIDANSLVVTQYEDVIDYEEAFHSPPRSIRTEEFFDTDIPGNRFPEDFVYFEKNRHPSIQEMIDISKKMGITYRQVYYRFRDFRCAFKVNCPENDTCRKVQKFFAQRAVFNGVLDATSVNIMYELFERYGHVGKSPDIGYTHLIAEKVDLPAFIVREQYKEWLTETDVLDPTETNKRYENIHQNLENEFNKKSKLSYERLVHLANKYETTQKVVLNFYESYSQRVMRLLNEKSSTPKLVPIANLPPANLIEGDSPTDVPQFTDDEATKIEHNRLYLLDSEDIGGGEREEEEEEDTMDSVSDSEKQLMKNCFYESTDGSVHDLFKLTMNYSQSDIISKSENVLRAMKLKFNMKKPASSTDFSPDSKRIKLDHPNLETSSHHTETEDEEIDIVGFDENVKETPIDELARTFVDSYPDIHEFPGDSGIFEKNRHPSIQKMIDISQKVGVTYEQVFQRFQHLRKLKNETCPVGDICQKVEMYSQMYSSLHEVIDDKTQNLMNEEFSKFEEFGPVLPLGHVHLIMEKVALPWRVVSVKYSEWYAEKELQKESGSNLASSSSLINSPQSDLRNAPISSNDPVVSLKRDPENDTEA